MEALDFLLGIVDASAANGSEQLGDLSNHNAGSIAGAIENAGGTLQGILGAIAVVLGILLVIIGLVKLFQAFAQHGRGAPPNWVLIIIMLALGAILAGGGAVAIVNGIGGAVKGTVTEWVK